MKLESLDKFLPEGALTFVENWLEDVHVVIKVKNSRRTKLGDYKFLPLIHQHQITIDRELDKEAFFFVLTHEIAHLKVQKKFGNSAKSHGGEWKKTFGNMLIESSQFYSVEKIPFILNHARNPKASLAADKFLYLNLFLDKTKENKLVENMTENQMFRIGKRIFQKGEKRKIRYICKELKTGKLFLVNGQALVDEIIGE